jgi:rsbT co-antagonist protein RsbR
MSDTTKTKQQLIDELAKMRQRVSEFEASEDDRKRLERKLKRSQQRFARLLDNLPDVVFSWSVTKGLQYVSPSVYDVTGYTPDELMGGDPMKGLKLAQTKHKGIYKDWTKSVTEEDAAPFEEFLFVRKDGSEGYLIAAEGILRDISRRKHMEEELRESEQRFRQIFEHVGDIIFFVNALGEFVMVNDRSYDIFGYRPDELIGRSFADVGLFDEDEMTRMTSLFANSVGKGEAVAPRLDLRAKHKDGHEVLIEVNLGSVMDPEGKLEGFMGVIRDISERKRMEDELRQSQERMSRLLENIPDVVFRWSMTDGLDYVSPAVLDVTGYTPEELMGEDPMKGLKLAQTKHKRIYDDWTKSVTDEEAAPMEEFVFVRKDGSEGYLELRTTPVMDDQGNLVAAEGILRDITRRRQMEEELQRHRDELEQRVEERTAELTRTQEIATRQAQEILEMSTPIIQIRQGVVLAPVIGTLNAQRAHQFTERLLTRLVETGSTVALVDITGVSAVDTQTAHYLIKAISAVKLLGAQAVLTGVGPSIARTLVEVGIELSDVVTRSSLTDGLNDAIKMLKQ